MKHKTLFLCLFAFWVAANAEQMRFRHFTMTEGLSQSTIRCFAQDQYGFIWIGTRDGLNRFDGYDFKVYRNNASDTTSLISNDIYALFVDRQGVLWVGTSMELAAYDPAEDCFKRRLSYRSIQDRNAGFRVNTLFEDSRGQLWVGTDGFGLFCISPDRKDHVHYMHHADNPGSLSHDAVWSIVEDTENQIWAGTFEGGLNRFNPMTHEFIHYNADSSAGALSNESVTDLLIDHQGTFWVGTYGGGVNVYDPVQDSFSVFGKEDGLVYDLHEDSQNRLWIALDGAGLLYLDENRRELAHFYHESDNVNSLSNDKIRTLFEDKQHNLWIGTFQGGVNFAGLNNDKAFHALIYQPGMANSLSHPNVTAVLADSRGRLWVGTDGGGIDCFDENHQLIKRFQHDPDDNSTLSHNAVLCIYEDDAGVIWAGTYLGGLNRYDETRDRFLPFRIRKDHPGPEIHQDIRDIEEDDRHRLWMMSNGGGVQRLNQERSELTVFRRNLDNPDSSLALDWGECLCIDSAGDVWMGTYLGLSHYSMSEKTFQNYYQNNTDWGLSSNVILDLYTDKQGRLWAATDLGLNVLTKDRKQFDYFSSRHGLPSDVVNSILEDQDGNFWLGTNSGIAQLSRMGTALDKRNVKIKQYNMGDGLPGNTFLAGSCFASSTGLLYFGSTEGLVWFHPDSIRDNVHLPEVVITDFKRFNQSVAVGGESGYQNAIDKNIIETDTLYLHHTDAMFSFEFSAMHFVAPDKNQYAYKMEGFDKKWVHCTADNRIATYTNLNPGTYTFKVKASNNDGIWNPEIRKLMIVIRPPFWQTWWFRTAMILLMLMAFGVSHLLRVQRLKRHRNELLQEVEKRTRELKERKEDAEQSNRLLKKEIRDRKRTEKKLEASNQELEQFAYVASHDLQEPLRMISSYLKLLVRRNEGKLDSDSEEFIDFAVDGAQRMQVMIQDLLTYSRVQTKGKPFETCDSNQIVQRVLKNLSVAVQESDAAITVDNLPVVMGDPVQLERLLQNLIGNAIKYRGKEAPVIHIQAEKSEKTWVFCIADNGIGIAPEFHERVFGIFQRLHGRDAYAGTGIGLAVCKRIVERHYGKVWIESEENQGARFYFSLPEAI